MDAAAQSTKGTTALIFDSSSVTALCPYLYFPIIMIVATTNLCQTYISFI